MNRHVRALTLARTIEANEHCPILSNDSIAAIEHALSDHAIDLVSTLRDRISAQTWPALPKRSAMELVSEVLREEVES